jgi:hypothetical protein
MAPKRPPRRAENIGFIKSSSGEPISGRNMLTDDHLLMILMSTFYHISEDIHSIQGGQLPIPENFCFDNLCSFGRENWS